ncbi:N-acetylglutaminylglutamine amidotransferase [Curtobacterium sp. VKM Ac-2852]|uniref:N-acetylglutaminylglutamine amidotransferase n=1 Tax=Curtobacterium sp. VKM Ac-2852 TaxID=2739024 RepID=UPI001565F540|nr:N-acetylglutaminylglutamine amidotransferase [Curtobacterium sp. VKM Ac-2852]NQX22875.1 N-acetylglutaminylglutamine amidotransferase [Curtobacterium sp. VKM Ac-2852]
MCGLAGEIRFDGRAPDVGAVARMTGCMTHRGPDGDGLWARGPVALGHRRLSIVDLSTAGAQPMVLAEAGLTIAYNGMVYNYRQLRDELHGKGHRFASTSDTEVIALAYAEWGTAFVDHLIGMFAIAIWEHGSGRLVLARDRLGIKPLYVAPVPGGLRFASSLPAILAGDAGSSRTSGSGGTGTGTKEVDTSIDPVAFASYMSFHSIVPAPRTILAGVGKLPPATVRVIEPDGTAHDTVYWEPRFERDPARADWSERDWEQAFIGSLRTAVERRMVADVPVGVLLSGGIDSSLVVGLLAEAGQQDLATFSIGFEAAGGESGDEFEYSDQVAAHFGTDHHRIHIPSSRLLDGIDGAVAAMSEPMVSHDCVAFYLLSQEVSQHVKVVQSGQGADEVLAGYDWYPPLADVPRDQAAEAYRSVFMDRRWSALQGLLGERWKSDDDTPSAFVDRQFARPGAETSVDAALRSDTTIMLVDDPVKRVDNMTMAWGLEARVPFLDHEFVELAAAIPPSMKLTDGGKGVMKRASRGIVPDAVIDRSKGSFPVPAIRQLEGPYLERVRDALHAPEARERGLFDPATVERMLQDPNSTRTAIGANALWQLGLIEMWLQQQGVR